jgi:hypothetical protein
MEALLIVKNNNERTLPENPGATMTPRYKPGDYRNDPQNRWILLQAYSRSFVAVA